MDSPDRTGNQFTHDHLPASRKNAVGKEAEALTKLKAGRGSSGRRLPWPYQVAAALALAGVILLVWWVLLVRQIPGFTLQEEMVEETDLTLRSGFRYTVDITAPTLVWPAGTTLESDRVLYPYAGKPVVRVQPVVEVRGSNSGTVDLEPEIALEAWGMTLAGKPVWSLVLSRNAPVRTRLELTGNGPVTWDGQSLTLDIESLRAQLTAIRQELGLVQTVHGVRVKLAVRGQADVADRFHAIDLSSVLPFTFESQGFSGEPLTATEVLDVRKSSRVVETSAPVTLVSRMLKPWPFLLAGGLGLVGALGLIVIYRRWVAREWHLPEHHRFKAWITEGKVNATGAVQTEVSSLEGLVDLAIDMNKRVIFDRALLNYHVLDSDILYTYRLPESAASVRHSSLPLGELLIQSGVVNRIQVSQALDFQRVLQRPMGECLITLDFLDEMTLYTTLAEQRGLPYLELEPDGLVINQAWLERLSIKRARLLQLLPLGLRPDGTLAAVIANPLDTGAVAALAGLLGHPVSPMVARPSLIRTCLDRAEEGTLVRLPPDYKIDMSASPAGVLTRSERAFLQEAIPGEPPPLELILKAAGYIRDDLLRTLHSEDKSVRQVLEAGHVHPDAIQLAAGARKALRGHWGTRPSSYNLGVVDLLVHASRLPASETKRWEEQALTQGRPLEDLLVEAYLLSPGTRYRAWRILAGLRHLDLSRSE